MTLLLAFFVLHPVHATSGEIEWNPTTRRLEVAWRIDTVDEYTLLRSIVDHDRTLSRTSEVTDKHRLAYVVEHFQLNPQLNENGELLRRKSGQLEAAAKAFHWVGREEKGASVWWYFEIEPAAGRRPESLAMTALWDVDDRYVHRLRCLDSKGSVSMTYSGARAVCVLPKPTPE